MLSRRSVIAGSAAALCLPRIATAEPALNDDGLYHQPWFLQSLLELPDDLKDAKDKGKRFAIMWELKGCPYCKKIHTVNLADPAIETFIRERFDILQLNIIGAREIIDFDGQRMPEKQFAQKYGVRFTPTFQFFPDDVAGLAQRTPAAREVARWQGYMEPKPFLAMFRYVAERAYDKGSLTDFLKANS